MGNTREVNGNAAILARINKGWKPNRYLTNMSMAYFADCILRSSAVAILF